LIETPESRSRIVKLISVSPGIHLRELQRALGVSFNSVRYNTKKLEERGAINCEKTKGHSRFFPLGMTEKDKVLYSCMRNITTLKLLQALTKVPQVSSKTLSEVTGYAKSTVSEHVHHLIDLNLARITLSKEGNFKVELLERERVATLIAFELQARDRDIIGNFADLWDF
jgi:predicted transcriptional regulator